MEWIEASHRCPTNDAQSTVAYWLGGCVDVIPHGLCNPYSMGDQFEKQRDLVARCADAPVDAGRLKGLVGDLPRAQHGIEVDKDFVGEHCEGHVAPLCQTVAEGTGQHHRIGLQRSKVQVLGWMLWQRDKRKIQLVVSQLGEEAHRKRHCHRRHDLGVLGGEPGDEGRQVQACERGNGPDL